MVIVKIQGGLGNQLFQYVFGMRTALNLGVQLKLDLSFFEANHKNTKREFELTKLGVDCQVATKKEVNKLLKYKLLVGRDVYEFFVPLSLRSYVREKYKQRQICRYLRLKDDVYLDGYWVDEKYFDDIRDKVGELFVFENIDQFLPVLNEMQDNDSISLHVRRGDYTTSYSHQFIQCDCEYYQKAIDHIIPKTNKPHVYVFSDDIIWVKRNLKLDVPTTYVTTYITKDNISDLYLMASCKHNIIANSTFSWWGAWLGNAENKLVVTPAIRQDAIEKTNWGFDGLIPAGWLET